MLMRTIFFCALAALILFSSVPVAAEVMVVTEETVTTTPEPKLAIDAKPRRKPKQVIAAAPKRQPESEWYPWFHVRQNVSQERLAQALRSEATAQRLFRMPRATIAQALSELLDRPVAVDELSGLVQEAEVVTCTPEYVRSLELGRVHRSGRYAINFSRSECYPGEELLTWRRSDGRRVGMSLNCGNPFREKQRVAFAPPPKPVVEECREWHPFPNPQGKNVIFITWDTVDCLPPGARPCPTCNDWLAGLRGHDTGPAQRNANVAYMVPGGSEGVSTPAGAFIAYCEWETMGSFESKILPAAPR